MIFWPVVQRSAEERKKTFVLYIRARPPRLGWVELAIADWTTDHDAIFFADSALALMSAIAVVLDAWKTGSGLSGLLTA